MEIPKVKRCKKCHCKARLVTVPPYKNLGWMAQVICTGCGNSTASCYANDYETAVEDAINYWENSWVIA